MLEIIWEYVVKPESQGLFELAYGPGGAWSKLFSRFPAFRGISLIRDANNPHRYLSFEFWETAEARQQALAERPAEHSDLISSLEEWTVSGHELGTFRALAEGTVRPHGRGKTKGTRGRGIRGSRRD